MHLCPLALHFLPGSDKIWTPNPKVLNDVYICEPCAAMTECQGPCKQTLPTTAFDDDDRGRMYKVCRECQWPKCAKCAQQSKTLWTYHAAGPKVVYTCTACAEKECRGPCKRSLPQSAFDRNKQRNLYQVCRECQYPNCSGCNAKSKTIRRGIPKVWHDTYMCAECAKKSEESGAQQKRKETK